LAADRTACVVFMLAPSPCTCRFGFRSTTSTQVVSRRPVIHERMFSPLNASLAAAMADALDNLSMSVFLVDAEGRIVHANAAAHLVLAERDFLCSAAGRLAACDVGANRTLQDALAAGHNGIVPAANGFALPLTARDGTRYVARILQLTAGARRRSGM